MEKLCVYISYTSNLIWSSLRAETKIASPLFFLVNFIGVKLVYKTIQVSSIWLNKTSSAHCIVHPSAQVKYLSLPISLPVSTSTYLPFPSSSGCHHPVVCFYVLHTYVILLNPFTFVMQSPNLSPLCLSAAGPHGTESSCLCLDPNSATYTVPITFWEEIYFSEPVSSSTAWKHRDLSRLSWR